MKNRFRIKKSRLKEIVKESIHSVLVKKERCSYNMEDIEELYEYMRLPKEQSGLNVEIFVDDCGSYRQRHHPLWVYVKNANKDSCGDFFPLSVSLKPTILDRDLVINLSSREIRAVKQFVGMNRVLIRDLANGKIDHINFVNSLVKLTTEDNRNHNSLLCEMATLKRNQSGLPMDIWVDECQTYHGHAPRIKFKASSEQRTTREFSSMLITDPDHIENLPRGMRIDKRNLDKLKEFVRTNQELLLALANQQISFVDFLQQMIRV